MPVRNALLNKAEAELLEIVVWGWGGLRVFFGAGCCLGGGGWGIGIGIGRTSGWERRGWWVRWLCIHVDYFVFWAQSSDRGQRRGPRE